MIVGSYVTTMIKGTKFICRAPMTMTSPNYLSTQKRTTTLHPRTLSSLSKISLNLVDTPLKISTVSS